MQDTSSRPTGEKPAPAKPAKRQPILPKDYRGNTPSRRVGGRTASSKTAPAAPLPKPDQ
ncbi:hypothetical protein DIPPA_15166 [Diplonema papillatum]|nr:hypothetical protein DIPPA_15166 [Diplonema papillatum]